jgi:hypothetical protein
MSTAIRSKEFTVLNAAAATGSGNRFDCKDYENVVVRLSAALNSSLTVKFQGAVTDSAPAFGSAQSEANHWDYVAAYDLQNPSSIIAGDTGVTLNNDTAANNCRQYIVNTAYLSYFNIDVSAYTDGAVTATVIGVSYSK